MNQTLVNEVYPDMLSTFFKDDLGIPADHIIDLFARMGGHTLQHPELFADGCHPNDQGYAVMAQAVLNAVLPFVRAIKSTRDLPTAICEDGPAPAPQPAASCADDPDGSLQQVLGLSCSEALAAVPTIPEFSGDPCLFDLSAWLPEELRVVDVCPLSCHVCADAPSEDELGEGCVAVTERMQQLQPIFGGCYASDPTLNDAITLWRQRASHEALEHLAALPDNLSARHLAINIAQMHDMYDVIDENADLILADTPGDAHALFVKALYAHAAEELAEYAAYFTRLRASSQRMAAVLDRVTADVVLTWMGYDSMRNTQDLVALAATWQPANLALVIFGAPVQPGE